MNPLEARVEELEAALERIQRWCEAYPEDVFIEPDWNLARELLGSGGLTLDAVTGGAIRRAVRDIGRTAASSLAQPGSEEE